MKKWEYSERNATTAHNVLVVVRQAAQEDWEFVAGFTKPLYPHEAILIFRRPKFEARIGPIAAIVGANARQEISDQKAMELIREIFSRAETPDKSPAASETPKDPTYRGSGFGIHNYTS